MRINIRTKTTSPTSSQARYTARYINHGRTTAVNRASIRHSTNPSSSSFRASMVTGLAKDLGANKTGSWRYQSGMRSRVDLGDSLDFWLRR